MRDQLVRQFLRELGRELETEGVEIRKRAAITGEVESHLVEAFEAASPINEFQEREVIRSFGSPRTLAKSLAREYTAASSRRTYLWPALFVLVAAIVGPFFLATSRVSLFGSHIWIGTIYLLGCSAFLLALGYRARRPLLGQFAALAVVLFIGSCLWLAATSYPVLNGPDYSDFVKPADIARRVTLVNRSIAQDRQIVSQLSSGQEFFSNPTERPAPTFLRSPDGYMLPEGVREVALGMVAPTGPSLTAKKWSEAVHEWNSQPYMLEIDGVRGRKTMAEVWRNRATEGIQSQEHYLQALDLSVKQPWWIRLGWTMCLVAPSVALLTAAATILTNAGWLLWLLGVPIGRGLRRIRLSAG